MDQFSWGAVTGQAGEPNNVSIEDTVGMNKGGSVCNFIFIEKVMLDFSIKIVYTLIFILYFQKKNVISLERE